MDVVGRSRCGARTWAVLAGAAWVVTNTGCVGSEPERRQTMGTNEGRAPAVAARRMTIELLALDLSTCGRCTKTSAHLDAALAKVAGRLRRRGVEVEVRRTVIRTMEDAVAARFVSSPTIRVDGRDVALELRESACGDCGDLCGEGVDCRVWVWRGREYEEAPEAMIVEAIETAASRPAEAPTRERTPYRLPGNLRRFFEAKARAGARSSGCCGPSEGCCG